MKPDGERIKGRRCYQCSHGIKFTSKASEKRPWQRLKFKGCPVKVNLNEQEDGTWMVTSLVLEHMGHPVTKANFYNHQVARKLDTPDKEYVKELLKARANPKNIANVLTQRKGPSYNAQVVRNLIARINVDEQAVASVEESLGELVDNGGEVRYKKQNNNDNVEVIWVQTRDMRSQLSKSSPRVFECDTTFGTQVSLCLMSYPLLKIVFSFRLKAISCTFLCFIQTLPANGKYLGSSSCLQRPRRRLRLGLGSSEILFLIELREVEDLFSLQIKILTICLSLKISLRVLLSCFVMSTLLDTLEKRYLLASRIGDRWKTMTIYVELIKMTS